jgi:hypothetical protein
VSDAALKCDCGASAWTSHGHRGFFIRDILLLLLRDDDISTFGRQRNKFQPIRTLMAPDKKLMRLVLRCLQIVASRCQPSYASHARAPV